MTERAREDPWIGRVVDGRYELIGAVGAGNMGAVYRARQRVLERDVAIKLIRCDQPESAQAEARFFREARAMSAVQHPNVVAIYDFGVVDDSLYLVMELLAGESLWDLLKREAQLTPARAIHLAIQACDGLEDAHLHGVVHRDVKPSNLFLTQRTGHGEWLKVLDFGIAKLGRPDEGEPLTRAGTAIGTPQYMSPEQVRGVGVDRQSDVYSLGVALYEMLTGVRPFRAPSVTALAVEIVNRAPPPLAQIRPGLELPEGLAGLVMAMLAKAPGERPAGMAAVRAALAACSARLATEGRPPPAPTLADAVTEVADAPAAAAPEAETAAPALGAVTAGTLTTTITTNTVPDRPPRSRWPLFAAGVAVALVAATALVVGSRPSATAWTVQGELAVAEPSGRAWTRRPLPTPLTWHAARQACASLRRDGRSGFRLPTQAEWSAAAPRARPDGCWLPGPLEGRCGHYWTADAHRTHQGGAHHFDAGVGVSSWSVASAVLLVHCVAD